MINLGKKEFCNRNSLKGDGERKKKENRPTNRPTDGQERSYKEVKIPKRKES